MSSAAKSLKVEHELHRLQIATGGGPMAYVVIGGSKTAIIEFLGAVNPEPPEGTIFTGVFNTPYRIIGIGATINEVFASARRNSEERIAKHAEAWRNERKDTAVLAHNRAAALAQSKARTDVLDAKAKKA
jgi:hypothetical protein